MSITRKTNKQKEKRFLFLGMFWEINVQQLKHEKYSISQRKYFPLAGLVWALHQRPLIHQPELQVRSSTRRGESSVNVSHWHAIATQMMHLHSMHKHISSETDVYINTHKNDSPHPPLLPFCAVSLSKRANYESILNCVLVLIFQVPAAAVFIPNVKLSPSSFLSVRSAPS